MDKVVWVVQHNIPLDALKPVMEAQPIEKGAISSRDMFITCCRELAETIYQLAHKDGGKRGRYQLEKDLDIEGWLHVDQEGLPYEVEHLLGFR